MFKLAKVWALACFLIAIIIYFTVFSFIGKDKASAATKQMAAPQNAEKLAACPDAREHSLPLPSSLAPDKLIDYQKSLFKFLDDGEYIKLDWCRDKGVRDTGPWVQGTYYGTHPAVRVYYSPRMMSWLVHGGQGPIPDGAMIVKEMFDKPPAARFQDLTPKQLDEKFAEFKDWTVMIKDSAGAKDGWYWTELYTGMTFDNYNYPFNVFNGGYGQYCLRCHASAERESTFSTLNNIEGFPGQPLTFRVDDSWRDRPALNLTTNDLTHPKAPPPDRPKPPVETNAEFLNLFKAIQRVPYQSVQTLPAETYDHVFVGQKGPQEFLTSDQCMMCHAALNGPFGPTMFYPTGPPKDNAPQGLNFSPYGEWRWSPMGLAGRDPIFYAQMESEIAYLKTIKDKKTSEGNINTLINTCFRCHGVMGKRQFDLDHGASPANPVNGPNFDPNVIFNTNLNDPNFKYGALARDGVSCAACHRIAPVTGESIKDFLEHSITGLFQESKPEELFGPFEDKTISTLPMKNALGIEPKFNAYIKDSRMCGSCHTINLPVMDHKPIGPVGPATVHSMEQATYLEWLNSSYENEFNPSNPGAKSCQDCHMSGGYTNAAKGINLPQLQERIAVIEDETYPASEHHAPLDQIRVRYRDKGYARHELLGLNAFLLEIFNQFNDILGVRQSDYMSGSKTDLPDAISNIVQQAEHSTATIEVSPITVSNGKLKTDVKVTNLTGHRFPSGVGFRRAFIEFQLIDNSNGRERAVWSSGHTNELGVIVDGNGNALPSEFFTEFKDKDGRVRQAYQPHYEKITRQDEAQIYEELSENADGKFTTSFIRRDEEVKDNRLLPKGWSQSGPSPLLPFDFLKDTFPKGNAKDDAQYKDGSGTDIVTYEVTMPQGADPAKLSVRVTLYYQAIPPYYLNMRFTEAPTGQATQRLYYLTSNLKLNGTPIRGWKLPVVSTSAPVVSKQARTTTGHNRKGASVWGNRS